MLAPDKEHKEGSMRHSKQLQYKIDSFISRKTSQYPEIDEYAQDISRL